MALQSHLEETRILTNLIVEFWAVNEILQSQPVFS